MISSTATAPQATDYLAKLNSQQRRAVEFPGAADGYPPLLIIAGAGSGKTNTLAHRVAHLLVNGADPRRMMLLTFSRRAATEMQKRVGRISSDVMGQIGRTLSGGLSWSGTFHAVGARLLREYALDVGLDREFTIHDREDSADLLNLVRHDLGFSKTERRFPMKGTCLSIYSRSVNAQTELGEILGSHFSGAPSGKLNFDNYLPLTSKPNNARTSSIMMIFFFIGRR